MLIGYYCICPRKAWLSMRGLWMEQESQAVALGRLVDQSSYQRNKKALMLHAKAPCGTPLVGKIDWAQLDHGVLHETKKGRSCEDAHIWQLRFYLWLLRLNDVTRADGAPFRGELNYPTLRRTESVELEPAHEARLADMVAALRRLARQIPRRIASIRGRSAVAVPTRNCVTGKRQRAALHLPVRILS
jgi:CRISPR-associated exonuclease Cas4